MGLDGDNQRVGIGTTSPTEKLDVVGNIVASGSLRSIYLDSEFAVSGDNTYSMVSGSEGLALYGGNSYIDLWTDSANSRRVRFRAQASDGSFDAGSYLDIYPSSVGATGDGAANIRGNGQLTILTADTDDLLIYSGHTLGLSFDNEMTVYSEADGNPRLMMRAASVAGIEFDGSHDIHFKNATSTKMTIETSTGKVGIGTTAPSEHLHVESDSNTQALFKSTDNRGLIQVADDDTTVSLVAEGTKASLGMTAGLNAANLNVSAVGHIGIGNTAPTFGVDVSGASTRTAMANVPYVFDVHAGFLQAAAIQPNAGNIAMIAPEAGTGPAGTTIPVYLPSTAAETTGLEITVVQDVAQNPGAALAVAGALGTSDAIYEGGSNSASATVSIAANRGANKTFINVTSGVWVLKE